MRPETRRHGFFDVLFEFKLVRRKKLGMKGQEIAEMDDAALRQLPAVADAFAEAKVQLRHYRQALALRFGEQKLRPRSYAVVAVGLERLLGEEVEAQP